MLLLNVFGYNVVSVYACFFVDLSYNIHVCKIFSYTTNNFYVYVYVSLNSAFLSFKQTIYENTWIVARPNYKNEGTIELLDNAEILKTYSNDYFLKLTCLDMFYLFI